MKGCEIGVSDRLGERHESRFENLKAFELDPMLLGGSAPKTSTFFITYLIRGTAKTVDSLLDQ